MSFHFSLQRILDLRIIEVDDAQKQVNNTKNAISKLKNLLEQERIQYFSDRDSLNESVKILEFTEINIYEKSLALHQNKMIELLKNIRELQNELKFLEENLVKSKLNKKIVEKLYTIKEKEYDKKEEEREQYLLDEMAAMRFRSSHLSSDSEDSGDLDE